MTTMWTVAPQQRRGTFVHKCENAGRNSDPNRHGPSLKKETNSHEATKKKLSHKT